MGNVTLSHTALTPTTKPFKLKNITISGKRNQNADPNANINGPIEVQTMSFENLKFASSGTILDSASGFITFDDILTIYKSTSSAILSITTGTNGVDSLEIKGLAGVKDIPVDISSFNLNIDASDSKEGYRPLLSTVFTETTDL